MIQHSKFKILSLLVFKYNRFHTKKVPCKLGFSIGFLKNYIPFSKKETPEDIVNKETVNIIERADLLYKEGRYGDVYQLLNQNKLYSNGEILWRICRAMYKLFSNQSLPKEVQGEMINEAHNLISIAHINHEEHCEINKWMAIILEAKCHLEGLRSKVQNYDKIKNHLRRSHELNPNDYSVLYMLGHWCYSSASLTWFQRKIVSVFYGHINCCQYEEALSCFSKAEDLKPRFFIPNVYMLGKVNLCLNRNFTGRYYLNVAANLNARNDTELQYQISARNLITELEYFDLCKYALFSDSVDL